MASALDFGLENPVYVFVVLTLLIVPSLLLTWGRTSIPNGYISPLISIPLVDPWSGTRLPPGPRGWPIVGNVTDMPKEKECLTFTRWAKEYGECLLETICLNIHELSTRRLGLYQVVGKAYDFRQFSGCRP